MRSYLDSWKEMNEKYDEDALFNVMLESFPQQGFRARADDAIAFSWREDSDHFL